MKFKKMKVYLWGERMRDMYPHATRWEVFKWKFIKCIRFILKIALLIGALYLALQIGRYYYSVEKVKIVEIEMSAPVLERIAKCESGGKQFGADGQVVLNGNTNGSVDIGKYQINTRIWGKKATELGYNLANEKDNENFAKYLYTTRGTEVWSASKKCWN
jgi:hypothetical protein